MNDPIQKALKSLRIARDELEGQLIKVNNSIKELETMVGGSDESVVATESPSVPYANEYDSKWSSAQKFLFLLSKEQRFLHFREAAKIIINIEGKGKEGDVASSLTTGCGSLKKKKTIVKFQDGKSNQNTYWGSPKWVDANGLIMPGYEFKKEEKKVEQTMFDL